MVIMMMTVKSIHESPEKTCQMSQLQLTKIIMLQDNNFFNVYLLKTS